MKSRDSKQRGIKWLGQATGASYSSVRKWLELGLPHRKEKNRVVFDEGSVVQWLVANRRAEYAAKITGCDVAVDIPDGGSVVAADSMSEMLSRARVVEQYCFEIVKQKQAENHADLTVWLEHYRHSAEQRRKIEKDYAGIQLSQGEVVPKDTVEEEMRRMALAVRQSLLAVPNSVAPRLEGKTAVEIAEELRKEVYDCLRHLSEVPDEVA